MSSNSDKEPLDPEQPEEPPEAEQPEEPELREFLSRVELALAEEPAALSCGEHILSVLQTP